MKALMDTCDDVRVFPGRVWTSSEAEPTAFYQRTWMDGELPHHPYHPEELNAALTTAVRSHLMGDVPYGLLISGGLDSSVIAAIAMKLAENRVDDGEQSKAWWPRIHSFSIGLEGSPDLAAAQEVADAIGTVHHPLNFTIQEGLDALREVIRHIETYDVTTIRAALYLMARKIKAMGIKMVLVAKAPTNCLAGTSTSTWPRTNANSRRDCPQGPRPAPIRLRPGQQVHDGLGIEARAADREFIDYAMGLDLAKMGGQGKIEKVVIREAFKGFLPEAI